MAHALFGSSASLDDLPRRTTSRGRYRAAGWGGIAAFVFWLLQPFLVLVVLGGEEAGSTYDRNILHPFLGTFEAVTFTGIGVGLLVMVTAIHALARDESGDTLPSRIGAILGVVAGVSWLAVAGIALAPFTSVGFFVYELVPGSAEQAAVYETLALMITAFGMTYALAMVGWLVVLATAGRRAGVIGVPIAVLALVAAAAGLLPLVMPFAPPWGVIGPLGFALVLGIVCLVKAHRLGRGEQAQKEA